MKSCLICYGKEPGKGQPAPDAEFICSKCTQELCNATQEQIKDLYQKAIDRGLDSKAEVLKSLMSEDEEENEQRNPKRNTTKCAYRKGSLRAPRNEQKPDWKFKEKQIPSFYQSNR